MYEPNSPAQGARITVFVPGLLRDRCGGAAELAIPASTVRAALDQLEARYPALHRCVCDETGAVRRHINLFVNDDHIRELGGLESPLTAGDVLIILPAVSGG